MAQSQLFPIPGTENSSFVVKESWDFAFLSTELGNGSCEDPKIQEASRTLPLDIPGLTNLHSCHKNDKKSSGHGSSIPLKQPSVKVLA